MDIKKLKNIIGKELADRKVYEDAYEVLSEVEKISGMVKNAEGRIKALTEQERIAMDRVEEANASAADAVIKSANRISEAEAEYLDEVSRFNKKTELIMSDSQKEINKLIRRRDDLTKQIREKEKMVSDAELAHVEAEGKLEAIRAQLRSI